MHACIHNLVRPNSMPYTQPPMTVRVITERLLIKTVKWVQSSFYVTLRTIFVEDPRIYECKVNCKVWHDCVLFPHSEFLVSSFSSVLSIQEMVQKRSYSQLRSTKRRGRGRGKRGSFNQQQHFHSTMDSKEEEEDLWNIVWLPSPFGSSCYVKFALDEKKRDFFRQIAHQTDTTGLPKKDFGQVRRYGKTPIILLFFMWLLKKALTLLDAVLVAWLLCPGKRCPKRKQKKNHVLVVGDAHVDGPKCS